MLVREIMTCEFDVLAPDAPVIQAAETMRADGVDALAVVAQGKPVGLLTERDIVVRVVAEQLDPATTPVERAMGPVPAFCDENERLEGAARRMAERRATRLLVVGADGRLRGLLSADDLARARPKRRNGVPAAAYERARRAGTAQEAPAGSRPSTSCPKCGMEREEWSETSGYEKESDVYCCQGCAEDMGCVCFHPAAARRAPPRGAAAAPGGGEGEPSPPLEADEIGSPAPEDAEPPGGRRSAAPGEETPAAPGNGKRGGGRPRRRPRGSGPAPGTLVDEGGAGQIRGRGSRERA